MSKKGVRHNIGPLLEDQRFRTRLKRKYISASGLSRGKWSRNRKNIGPQCKGGNFLSACAIQRKWRAANLDLARSRWRQWRKDNPGFWTKIGNRYSRMKHTSKQRGLEFNLSLEEYKHLVENKPCYYCGASLDGKAGWSVDRVDSTKGYVPGNCVPCCSVCNIMKASLTLKQFYAHIENILAYRST